MTSCTDLICVKDYESRALALLDTRYADFYSTGADDEQTLADNEADFKRWRLRPRILVDVSNVSLTTSILGQPIPFPVCIAPTSQHMLAHPQGEMATASGAHQMGTVYSMSTSANTSMVEIAQHFPNLVKWFQLYVYKDFEISKALIRTAEQAGFKALILTVDLPVIGNRRRRKRNNFSLPPYVSLKNLEGLVNDERKDESAADSKIEDKLTWSDLERIISLTTLPVVVKGILTGEDADAAVRAGCSAVYVSNHGGRQLDGVLSGIAALSEVVEAVEGRVEVYVDGGFRTGTDVLKALALGARAVFVGRPVLYGLAVKGEDGVKDVLTMFKDELKLAIQLSGCTDVETIPKSIVVHESEISRL